MMGLYACHALPAKVPWSKLNTYPGSLCGTVVKIFILQLNVNCLILAPATYFSYNKLRHLDFAQTEMPIWQSSQPKIV
jgi:hypothetical protein